MTLEAPKPGPTPAQPHPAPLPTLASHCINHTGSAVGLQDPHPTPSLAHHNALLSPAMLPLFCLEVSTVRPKSNDASCLASQN